MSNENSDKVRTLLNTGGDLAGAAVGGALGFLTAGPAGAAGAAAGSLALTKIAKALLIDFANRGLSHREEIRVGAVAALVIEGIRYHLEEGRQPKNLAFLDESTNGRSKAEELFEGVLQKSKNEYQEKKIKYYANIFITALFNEQFSPETVNHVLALAERLTYRQLCLLSLFSRPQPIPLRDKDYHSPSDRREHPQSRSAPNASPGPRPVREDNYETVDVLAEVFNLHQLSLVRCYMPGSKSARERIPIQGVSDIRPSWMVRIQFGDRLHRLMGLDSLPYEDLESVADTLKE